MIPDKKKTTQVIVAVREDLGISEPSVEETQAQAALTGGPVIHLDIPPIPLLTRTPQPHSLRKHDLPLAPAPPVTHKTTLPTHRQDHRDIAQIRKREALAKLDAPGLDPVARLLAQTAHPLLYVPGYLLAIAAAASAYQRVHHITPIILLTLSLLITIAIAVRKPRSRHHAALIFILIFLTAALGGIHYAPLFRNGP